MFRKTSEFEKLSSEKKIEAEKKITEYSVHITGNEELPVELWKEVGTGVLYWTDEKFHGNASRREDLFLGEFEISHL